MKILLTTTTFLLMALSNNSCGQRNDNYNRPNFSGQWENLHEVPVQRPLSLGKKRFYTEDEANSILLEITHAQEARNMALDGNRPPPAPGAIITNQADDDFDEFPSKLMQIDGEYRTSIIIKPENGRFQKKEGAMDYITKYRSRGISTFDGPESAGANERCLHQGWIFPFMGNTGLSKYGQIVQTDEFLMILGEYPYYARIIPILEQEVDDTYFTNRFAKWMGHSYAIWDENKLSVTTTLLRDEQSNLPSGSSLGGLPVSSVTSKVEETYELLSDDQIFYRWEFTDEELLTESVVGEVLLTRMEGGRRIYEYACHEGNYNLAMILGGARRADWEAQQAQYRQ